MSTKTMRLPPRRVVTPSNNGKSKRNAGEQNQPDGGLDAVNQSTVKKPKLEPDTPLGSASSSSPPPNLLLAGYLAHEFRTKGTLFGKPWDSAGSEQKPTVDDEAEPIVGADGLERYVAVSGLLSLDGSHLAGVVNPAQLARLLQL